MKANSIRKNLTIDARALVNVLDEKIEEHDQKYQEALEANDHEPTPHGGYEAGFASGLQAAKDEMIDYFKFMIELYSRLYEPKEID